ncbi:DUF2007 domain-containing protein [Alkalimonas sp. MEB108]|uniref:DUF2007 domain-containing protein n=1 Tax=Alkalimonas cellulosilytica TaxID=3058395 RepID=A0ABU7J542_9GAMM|nr:DUF2007 domain-containing protein [Alkalimonas sp. MEB108]MEE2001147.1 DUF2007 domain-containing protein [Alkalimonas sp. MEB108]
MSELQWQLVYHAASEFEAALLTGLLQNQCIEARYQGQLLLGAIGELPPTDIEVAIWVKPHQATQALAIIQNTKQQAGTEWRCACGETNAPEFELCWACGRDKDESD